MITNSMKDTVAFWDIVVNEYQQFTNHRVTSCQNILANPTLLTDTKKYLAPFVSYRQQTT